MWGSGDYAGTYRGHVVGMRAGTAAIEYIQVHDLLAHARDLGESIRARLNEAAEGNPRVGEVRGKGLFIGAELVDEDGATDGAAADTLKEYCHRSGVIVWTAGRHDNVLRVLPPLVLTEEVAETALDVIVDDIQHISSGRSTG